MQQLSGCLYIYTKCFIVPKPTEKLMNWWKILMQFNHKQFECMYTFAANDSINTIYMLLEIALQWRFIRRMRSMKISQNIDETRLVYFSFAHCMRVWFKFLSSSCAYYYPRNEYKKCSNKSTVLKSPVYLEAFNPSNLKL